LEYNPTRSEVVLYPDEPLQVVDGQHRIAGLRYAIEEKNRADLAELEIPFVIMEEPDRIEEMNQFRVVNGTAKSVRTDLVNAILTATAAARGEEAIKDSDRWKVVATRAIDTLNKEPNSPWYGLILMPDDAGSPNSKDGTGKIVRATSFMTSIKPVYEFLRKFNFLTKCNNTEEEAAEVYKVLASYWKALQLVVPEPFEEPNKHVIQKTPGLFSLHKLLVADLLPNMFRGHREWTTENFVEFLQDSPEITEANFWHIAGGHASSYGSMKGFDELYKLLSYSVEPKP
jgi:DGQHR domain-containing protein